MHGQTETYEAHEDIQNDLARLNDWFWCFIKCFFFGKVFFKHSWPLFQGMLRLSDAPFRAVRPQQGFFCPWVNSLPILDLCPCGLRNGRSVYSLEDQHASLWPWPSHSYSASCRSRRCSWPLLFKAFSWGNTCGNILCTVCLFIYFICAWWVPSPTASSSSLF